MCSANMSGHFVTFVVKLLCNFSPLRSVISLGCFPPTVGCELNVNARMCKNDMICFISFVLVSSPDSLFCMWVGRESGAWSQNFCPSSGMQAQVLVCKFEYHNRILREYHYTP